MSVTGRGIIEEESSLAIVMGLVCCDEFLDFDDIVLLENLKEVDGRTCSRIY